MWNTLADMGDAEPTFQKIDISKKKNNIDKENSPRINTDLFSKLPNYFLFDILAKIPATYLHENASLTCKFWRGITSSACFIAQNARQTKPMLLLQWSKNKQRFIKRKLMEVEDNKLNYKFHDFESGLCKSDLIRSSCNGLILVSPAEKNCKYNYLEVMNLATKKCAVIPPPCPSWCSSCNGGVALGFDPKIKKYKVVHNCDNFEILIFTLGDNANKWRPFSILGKKRPSRSDFRWNDPVVIKGRFFHWNVNSDEYIFAMDISAEKLVKLCISCFGNKNYTLMESDGSLTLVQNISGTQIDIWVLQNVNGLAWVRKYSILVKSTYFSVSSDSSSSNLIENNFPDLSRIVPIGCARKGEILIFKYMRSSTDFRMYLYDTVQREMKKFKMTNRNLRPLIPHKSTLFHWNN